jgi:hypothetical protein
MILLNKSFKTVFDNNELVVKNLLQLAKNLPLMTELVSSESDGYSLFDLNDIHSAEENIISRILVEMTKKNNIDINNYYIIIRATQEDYDIDICDMCAGYGEYHTFKDKNGNIKNDVGDFVIQIFVKEADDIITVTTDLIKNDSTLQEPKINEVTLHRGREMYSHIMEQGGSLLLKSAQTTSETNFGNDGQWSFTIQFHNKNDVQEGSFEYPNFKDVLILKGEFLNNNERVQLENVISNTKIENEVKLSCSNDLKIKSLINNYSFEMLYKSIFPANYKGDWDIRYKQNLINNTDERFAKKADMNKDRERKLEGEYIVHYETKEIMNKLYEFMIMNDINTLTLIN